MVAALALGGALCWGVGDFLGGLASRRLAVLAVLVVSQAVGLLGVGIWVALSGESFPGAAGLVPAAAAGLAGLVGLAALYRGFAIGAMGVVAPVSAASPVVPLAVDAARGIVPSPAQWTGVVLILAGVAALSREPAPHGRRTAAGSVSRSSPPSGSELSSSRSIWRQTRARRGRFSSRARPRCRSRSPSRS